MSGWTDEKIITLIRSKLSADRFNHSLNVADSAKELASFALSDKKRTGGTVSLVVPRAIGRCEILSTPVEELENFIQAGL